MKRFTAPDIFTDFLIIGAGPAGLLISKKLAENQKDVWVLGSPYESQLAKAGEIMDSRILKKGTIGLQLIEKLLEETKKQGTKHKSSKVTTVKLDSSKKEIKTQFQAFYAETVIIATGAKQPKLGFSGEEKYFRKGVSDCTVCDGNLFKEQPVAIVGSHKYTLNGAEFLSKIASEVHLLWNKHSIPDETLEKLSKLKNLSLYVDVENLEADGSDVLEKIKFSSEKTHHSKAVNALFVEGKPVPSTEIFPQEILNESSKHVNTIDTFKTKFDKVYAFGEVTRNIAGYDEIVEKMDSFIKHLLK